MLAGQGQEASQSSSEHRLDVAGCPLAGSGEQDFLGGWESWKRRGGKEHLACWQKNAAFNAALSSPR